MTTSSSLTIPAVGHPFTLGALYNSRTSQIIPGVKLFTAEQMQTMLTETKNISMETDIVTETSANSKNLSTKVTGNLSLSILSGLVSASGSGNYQTTLKEKKETESAIYRLQVQGKYWELVLPPDLKLEGSASYKDATHVVLGIQYGGAALFFFERDKEDSATSDKTGGGLKAQIGKFASLVSISGAASLDMTSEETKVVQKIRVAYKGDFHLASPPTNFIEAMKCIQTIQAAEARSPLTVNLLPLSLLVEDAPPAPLPLPPTCICKTVRCYEVLKGALTTLEEIIYKLRPTAWTHVVKKLEAEVRELESFKSSLDDAVQEAVLDHTAEPANQASKIGLKTDLFDTGKKYAHLQEWATAVADAGDVLVVISNKFREAGAQIIKSQAQRAEFIMRSMTEQNQKMYCLSCPMKLFELQNFEHQVGLKLWSNEQLEKKFYKTLVEYCPTPGDQKLKLGQSIVAVEQSEVPDSDASGVQVTFRNLSSDSLN